MQTTQSHHTALLRGIYEIELRALVANYASRIIAAKDFATGLPDPASVERHGATVQLEAEFKRMREAGVVRLMADVMPLECMIVDHYEEFLSLI
jgi:hypothetical protein